MPAFTQKYTIIQLLEDVPEGTQFTPTNWPLHATVGDTFAIDWEVPLMIGKLKRLLDAYPQTTSVAIGDDLRAFLAQKESPR